MTIQEIRTSGELEAVIKTGVTLVDFNAPWCSPCRSQEPILESVSDQFDGRVNITSVNIDDFKNVAVELGIRSIPTLLIFKDNVETQRFIGLQSEATLSEALQKQLN